MKNKRPWFGVNICHSFRSVFPVLLFMAFIFTMTMPQPATAITFINNGDGTYTLDFEQTWPGDVITFASSIYSGLTPLSVGNITLSGADASDFNLEDGCSGQTLPADTFCPFTVNFAPYTCGNKSATITMPTSDPDFPIWTTSVTGTACGSGTGTVLGSAWDAVTKAVISGVAITVGVNGVFSTPFLTDTAGSYSEVLTPGTYDLRASKQGYDTWVSTITINPQQSTIQNLIMKPSPPQSTMRVTSVTSKYSKGSTYYFLPGIPFNVAFTATVDWADKSPGIVRFSTPVATYDVPATGTTAEKTINVGTEFQFDPCSTMTVMAIAADGTQSPDVDADFSVMPHPLGLFMPDTPAPDFGNGFFYKTIQSLTDIPIISSITPDSSSPIPADMPLVGGKGFSLEWSPKLEREVTSTGKVSMTFNNEFKPSFKLLGATLNFTGGLGYTDQFVYPGCYWKGAQALVKIIGQVEAESPAYYVVPPIPLPPVYVKVKGTVSADGTATIESLSPLALNGGLRVSGKYQGVLGVGINKLLSYEGWIGLGMDFLFQLPSNPGYLRDVQIVEDFFTRAQILLYRNEVARFKKTWSLLGGTATAQPAADAARNDIWTLIPREYLKSPSAGRFTQTPKYSLHTALSEGKTYTVASAPIVTSTYPYSAPILSSSGSSVNLLWLADNPARSTANRTMVIHSIFDGAAWSTPIPIADNGTADFSPASLTFADGSMVAAWGDVKAPLPDTATLDQMTSQLEVATAIYDPVAKTWGPALRLTDNAYLDHSPQLAGLTGASLILTWIGNDQNDFIGGAAHPNTLYYAHYDGTSWSAPEIAAVIPYQIKQYSLVYDGITPRIALALDTDNNMATLDDQELFLLTMNGGVWSGLTRLTTDTVIDDNPQLALDSSNNVIMIWIKGGEISSVVNFDFSTRQIIRSEPYYSSTLADFKQARSSDGRIVLVYADKSGDNRSDLFGLFFNPDWASSFFATEWAIPKQLTFDAETEQWPAIAFMGSDTIIGAYNRKLLVNPDGTPAVDPLSDLYMLKYTMGFDIALEPGSLKADPPNAPPGTAVLMSVTAQNLSELPTSANVFFYDSDPATGSLPFAVAFGSLLLPGESRVSTAINSWPLPIQDTPVTVYAVIDIYPEDTNPANNTVSTTLYLPDLKIGNLRGDKLTDTRFGLVVSVANTGGTASPASTVTLHNGSATGPVIAVLPLPALARYDSVDLAFDWSASPTVQPWYTVVAVVDEANAIPEFNEQNNSMSISLEGHLQDIALTPNPIVFPDANVGDRALQILTVRNAGTAPLNLAGTTMGGADAALFSVLPGGGSPCTPFPSSLAPGMSCTLEVSLTPPSLGAKNATVTINSNDADTPSVALPITVTAVDIGPPVISTFVMPSIITRHSTPITALIASDNIGINGWLLTESATPPAANDTNWLPAQPTVYTVSNNGPVTLSLYAKDAAGNISLPKVAPLTVSIPSLGVSLAGNGHGTVTSIPPGISCPLGVCTALFDESSSVSLAPTPDDNSIFSGWSSGCSSISGNSCGVAMSGNKTFVATFVAANGVRIGTVPYASLTLAFNDAAPGALIEARDIEFQELLTVSRPATFIGGYDAGYTTTNSNFTLLRGVLTIGTGALTVKGLAIR